MAFFILTRFVLIKYSCAFIEWPSQDTSSLASQLTTVSLDIAKCNSLFLKIYKITCKAQLHAIIETQVNAIYLLVSSYQIFL